MTSLLPDPMEQISGWGSLPEELIEVFVKLRKITKKSSLVLHDFSVQHHPNKSSLGFDPERLHYYKEFYKDSGASVDLEIDHNQVKLTTWKSGNALRIKVQFDVQADVNANFLPMMWRCQGKVTSVGIAVSALTNWIVKYVPRSLTLKLLDATAIVRECVTKPVPEIILIPVEPNVDQSSSEEN